MCPITLDSHSATGRAAWTHSAEWFLYEPGDEGQCEDFHINGPATVARWVLRVNATQSNYHKRKL